MSPAIKIFHDHNCLLTYTKKGVLPGEADEVVEREFWAPPGGGCVYEIDDNRPGTSGTRVCRGLRYYGAVLYWTPGAPLSETIKSQYRAAVGAKSQRGW